MANFNKVILMGNITREPELRHTQGGMAVCKLGLAVNRKSINKITGELKESACFVDCTAFGKQAELINEHLHKGSPLFVEGRLEFSTWEDKQSGAKRSKLEVIVEQFQFMGGAKQGERSGGGRQRQESQEQGGPDYGTTQF